jgi:hypothetical protein
MRRTSSRIGDREETVEKHTGLSKMVQILSFLLVFVAGVVIGLATTSHIDRHYFVSHAELYSNCATATTVVKACEKPVDCMSMEAFLKPSNVTHGMSDDELLWRASMVFRKKEYPYKTRVPKVAFMFLTRGPLPMLPLWERFFTGGRGGELFSIYVHSPPGYVLNVSRDSPFYGRQIPSQVST